jgi:hypothetical protein
MAKAPSRKPRRSADNKKSPDPISRHFLDLTSDPDSVAHAARRGAFDERRASGALALQPSLHCLLDALRQNCSLAPDRHGIHELQHLRCQSSVLPFVRLS